MTATSKTFTFLKFTDVCQLVAHFLVKMLMCWMIQSSCYQLKKGRDYGLLSLHCSEVFCDYEWPSLWICTGGPFYVSSIKFQNIGYCKVQWAVSETCFAQYRWSHVSMMKISLSKTFVNMVKNFSLAWFRQTLRNNFTKRLISKAHCLKNKLPMYVWVRRWSMTQLCEISIYLI